MLEHEKGCERHETGRKRQAHRRTVPPLESKQGISFNPQLKGQVSDTGLRPVSQLWRHQFRVGGSHRRAGKQGHQLKCHPSNFLPIIVRFNSFLNGEWGLALASRLGSQPLETAN